MSVAATTAAAPDGDGDIGRSTVSSPIRSSEPIKPVIQLLVVADGELEIA